MILRPGRDPVEKRTLSLSIDRNLIPWSSRSDLSHSFASRSQSTQSWIRMYNICWHPGAALCCPSSVTWPPHACALQIGFPRYRECSCLFSGMQLVTPVWIPGYKTFESVDLGRRGQEWSTTVGRKGEFSRNVMPTIRSLSVSQKFFASYVMEDSLLCPQKKRAHSCPELCYSVHVLTSYCLKTHFNIIMSNGCRSIDHSRNFCPHRSKKQDDSGSAGPARNLSRSCSGGAALRRE
jgi:hypothetical protein